MIRIGKRIYFMRLRNFWFLAGTGLIGWPFFIIVTLGYLITPRLGFTADLPHLVKIGDFVYFLIFAVSYIVGLIISVENSWVADEHRQKPYIGITWHFIA